ncbi:MAG: 50S ribosomal protein L23 [Clostridiales Family XIII bacterium]|jgi:large subunit ribosomal protein L23|nr:50S ribosomal protein L23 [Clostridiales Family XIII bacterium]
MRLPYDVIIKPVISEKSMSGAEHRKYTFHVATDADKIEIKRALEEIFGVEVARVNVMNYTGKLKRMGKNEGRRSSFKKAIVTLTKDSKEIEFFQSL